MIAVAVVWLIAETLGRRGPVLTKRLLLLQFMLLCFVLVFSIILHPSAQPQGLAAGVAAMLAVSAMGCQFALLRLSVPGAPSTAVMTGNPCQRRHLADGYIVAKGGDGGLS